MGIAILSRFSMTFLGAVGVAILASVVSAEITCDDCLVFSGNMQTHLMSAESVGEQTELLIGSLCPTSPDPAQCEEGFKYFWSQVAAAMYPVFLEPGSICGQLGACKVKTLVGEPTCDECKGSMDALAKIIGSESQIDEVISFLKGDGLCAGSPYQAECEQFAELAMPYAMPVLAQLLIETADEHCCEQSPSGVCC